MYPTCAFPGCDTGFNNCEIHHLLPFELGGNTDLDNLLPLCSRHHHVIHEPGWQLTLADDRTLTVHQPDGTIYGCQPLRSADTRPVLRNAGEQPEPATASHGTSPPDDTSRTSPHGISPPSKPADQLTLIA